LSAGTTVVESSGSIGRVSQSLDLANGSLFQGNYVPTTCLAFSDVAVAPSLHRVFVSCTATNALVAFNETSGAEVGSVQVGYEPVGVTFDPDNDRVYVADTGGTVDVVAARNMTLLSSIQAGCAPYGVAYDDATARIYVSDSCSGNVTVISTANDSTITAIAIGQASQPQGIVYDPFNRDVYVAESLNDLVGVISPANDTLNSTVSVGGQPTALASNPATGDVYVTDETGLDLEVISGVTQRVVASVNFGIVPLSVAYDSNTNRIYVSTIYRESNVTAINASTLSIVANVTVHSSPEGIAIDSEAGRVYVSNYDSSDLAVINESAWAIVGYFRSDPAPVGVAWNSVTRDVYVTNQVYGTLDHIDSRMNVLVSSSVLSQGLSGVVADPSNGHLFVGSPNNGRVYITNSNGVVQSFTGVGGDVGALAYDSDNGYVYATNYMANFVSVFNGSTGALVGNISLLPYGGIGGGEKGIAFDPTNGYLYVAYGGCTCGPSPGNVTIINGATDQAVGGIYDWANPGPSAVAVDTQNNELYVTDDFANLLWAFNTSDDAVVSTTPVGATPEGIAIDNQTGDIYVTNSGSANVSVIDSSTNRVIGSIAVGLTPMGVTFDPDNGNIYVANEDSGTLSVIGQPRYTVSFNESGLPLGTNWSVALGGVMNSTETTALSFQEPNGSYTFSVEAADKEFHAPGGVLAVQGGPLNESIAFAEMTYEVAFAETGLPTGSNWSIALNGSTRSSLLTNITFVEPNGSYSFSVTGPSCYLAKAFASSVEVNGSGVTVPIQFLPSPCGAPRTPGLSIFEESAILGGIAAVIAIGAAVVLVRSRRKKRGPLPPTEKSPP
jgi:YVTN family beta-propeller protein